MENTENKLFEGLAVTFNWTEGEPIKLRSGEVLENSKNKTFYGEEAYEILVALALKDKKIYEKSKIGNTFENDKCKFSLSLASREGKEGFEYKDCRMDLSELNLNCGRGPLDSIAWRLAGQEVELYTTHPGAFRNSYHYAKILETEKNEATFVNGHPSIKLARNNFLKEHQKILDAFYPYALEEDKYLNTHLELKNEFQKNIPRAYTFLISAKDFEEYVPKCEIMDFKVARDLDGKVYKKNPYFTRLDERNFEDAETYNEGYYIVASAFSLGEWERNNGKFLPYFTKEEYNALQNINEFEFTKIIEKHPIKNFIPLAYGQHHKYQDNEFMEQEANMQLFDTSKGIEALNEFEMAIMREKSDISMTQEYGFNYEEGEKHYKLKYKDNIILDETSHCGIDNNLIKSSWNENSSTCLPLPKDKNLAEEIKKGLILANMYFRKIDDIFYFSKYDFEESNKPIPSIKEMKNNRIQYLKKQAQSESIRGEKKTINNSLMVLADMIANKKQFKAQTKIENFAVAYTIVAAEAGFNQDEIKDLANYISKEYNTTIFFNKVKSTLRTKQVKEIISKNDEKIKQNQGQSR